MENHRATAWYSQQPAIRLDVADGLHIEAHLTDSPPREELETVFEILRSYNCSKVGPSGYEKLVLLLKDDQGTIKGGLEAHTYFQWMFIENLAVDESVRKSGWGSKLLEAAHEEARRRGCGNSWLDTFGFQALPFYQKLGYTVFGALDDFPPGYKRYFLTRAL